MKKWLIRISVLLLLFLTSVGVTAVLINQEKTVGVRKMEDPTLPVMYMEVADVVVNPMYGYAQQMEQQYMRDSITPLVNGREVSMILDLMNSHVESVGYEVSTADGTEVIETVILSGLEEDKGKIKKVFQLETPILMNQEYTLRFDVTLENGKTYYYYTRILQRAGVNVEDYLEFAQEFYQKCFNSESTSDLAAYLEPDATETNSTYTSLNIHSSYDRVTWGNMNIALEQKAIPVIKDLNETTCSISMDYVLSDQKEEGAPDYYNVTDFYRMRNTQSRVLLLDFERSTQEIYDEKMWN